MKPKLAPQKVERDLSKLVNLRTVQKPISDARTATYVILSIGSGPGGRRFKSFRPDQFLTPAGNSLKIGCASPQSPLSRWSLKMKRRRDRRSLRRLAAMDTGVSTNLLGLLRD